jgi:hypothetical protein
VSSSEASTKPTPQAAPATWDQAASPEAAANWERVAAILAGPAIATGEASQSRRRHYSGSRGAARLVVYHNPMSPRFIDVSGTYSSSQGSS